MIEDRLKQLKGFDDFHLGHTPFQIAFFKTTAQKGNREFEYWQHVVQLKALVNSTHEMRLEIEDLKFALEDAESWFPFWTRKRRERKIPRLKHQISNAVRSLAERELEITRHLDVIDEYYSDFKGLSEEALLKHEKSYWTTRLGRQVAFSTLSARMGLSPGDLSTIASLPEETQRQIFACAERIVQNPSLLITGSTDG